MWYIPYHSHGNGKIATTRTGKLSGRTGVSPVPMGSIYRTPLPYGGGKAPWIHAKSGERII